MKIHNEDIFHCVRCGKLDQQEQNQPVPYCCGAPMARAACQTVQVTVESASSPESGQPARPAGSAAISGS